MPRRPKAVHKAVASVVETLENRTLLTTLVGGGVDPVTGDPIAIQYTYRDQHDNICIISVGGDTTIEAIAARVPAMGFGFALDDLSNGGPGTGRDLFQVYVSESDSRSFVTVARTLPGVGIAPFQGDAGAFAVPDAVTGLPITITPNGGTGGIVLGSRTRAGNFPLISHRFTGAFGVRPATPANRITAGLEVGPGLDFGKFYFGGVVMGAVSVPGSMESFYAGNLWTGDATGLSVADGGVPQRRRTPNFFVGGNLNSLLVAGSIGTNTDTGLDQPNYLTGTDIRVGGVLGQVAARDSVVAPVNAQHQIGLKGAYGANVAEVEGRGIRNSNVGWTGGNLTGDAIIFDDSFATAQVLPSFAGKRHRSSVIVNGELNAVPTPAGRDYVDYYGMAMLAGQSLTVQLSPTGTVAGQNLMNVGVFDPDGRLIATDYPNVDQDAVIGAPLHFTADRPGLYRIAVAGTRNGDFTVGGEFPELNIGLSPYTLVINGGGDVGMGGVIATNNIWESRLFGYGYQVEQGDMGALEAGGTIFSTTDQSVVVRRGSLRSIDGAAVGVLVGNALGDSPNLYVQRGNVGLVRGRTGIVTLNESVLPLSIGGNYQVVSAGSTLLATLISNYSIGVIRAGSMATTTPSIFTVNADLVGDDGVIDLIDVAGDLGTLGVGGPAITTGPGGNVRYMNVGGNTFRDAFFGGNAPDAVVHQPGETVKLTDDSGAKIELVPFPLVPNPNFILGGTNPAQIGPTLTVTAYPIRGSGGVALVNVTSTGSVRVGVGGAQGTQSHAEVGLIRTTGTGNPVIRSTNDGSLIFSQPTTGTAAVNLDVLIDGSARVDVYKVQGSDFTSIVNETPGEILNIDATDTPTAPPATNVGTIGNLQATTIGTGLSRTGAMVNGIQVIGNAFPFLQQHQGVVSGTIMNVEASGPVGNLNVTGSIGTIRANSGGRHTTHTFEGINGPISVSDAVATVDIGDGILPSGSGNLSKSGLYVGGILGTVRNRGLGSDIRGDILSNTQINEILLTDGAIIGNKILVATPFTLARRFSGGGALTESTPDDAENPFFDIGKIALNGIGGIIGSDIEAADLGPVTVHGGFGIINSRFADSGDGTFAKIEAEGYGLRGVDVDGGANLRNFSATSKPANVSVETFTKSVLQSEKYDIDPFFDQAPSRETDLHVYLGTSANKPQVKRVTDTGVIADSTVAISRDTTKVFASQIRASSIHSGNSISSIETRGAVDALEITTGRLRSYLSGAGSTALDFNIAGILDNFHSGGVVDSTSRIRALGSSAHIYNFIVDGSLDGDVSSTNELRFLAIGKDLGASSLVKVKSLLKQQIKGSIFGTIQIG